jgi:predicted dehydrogenase
MSRSANASGKYEPRTANRFGVAVVGLGQWGRNYLSTLSRFECCPLFGCEKEPRSLPDFPNVPIVTFSELLSNPSVQAVIIASPDYTHFELAAAALAAGKDVLVEKPMALSVAEAEEILRLSSNTRRIVAVGHTALYSFGFEQLQERIESGALGRVLKVEAVRTSRGRSNGGSILWDLAPHDLAMAITLFGQPVATLVTAYEFNHCSYQLTFEQGIVFSGEVGWTQPPFYRQFRVFTTTGIYTCDEPIGVLGNEAESPLNRLCRDFIFACQSRKKPRSDAVLGRKVIQCLAALSEGQGEVTLHWGASVYDVICHNASL